VLFSKEATTDKSGKVQTKAHKRSDTWRVFRDAACKEAVNPFSNLHFSAARTGWFRAQINHARGQCFILDTDSVCSLCERMSPPSFLIHCSPSTFFFSNSSQHLFFYSPLVALALFHSHDLALLRAGFLILLSVAAAAAAKARLPSGPLRANFLWLTPVGGWGGRSVGRWNAGLLFIARLLVISFLTRAPPRWNSARATPAAPAQTWECSLED
jgi:hypothetical protein